MAYKAQRVRDPLHNLIEFEAEEFSHVMWSVVQTREFQRLRRVKQLGFSDLVYPGATHTRFAHSLGVFHTARMLLRLIERQLDRANHKATRAQIALAAALVHDLGHGPFSHAFEDVGKRLNLRMASHETLSDELIRQGEVGEALKKNGSGFANDVADLIGSERPQDIYGAVVSSQFDADRLDYMRRDRLMTGTHHGGIDFDWLLSNIEIGEVSTGVDEVDTGKVPTFVLGPKSIYAAESYVLGLFQLYPTVYFHKATRGAEKLFSELLERVFVLCQDGSPGKTGLTDKHPLILFAKEPDKAARVLDLDDTVFWGALPSLCEAEDQLISDFARRLRDRKLYKCIDVRETIVQGLPDNPAGDVIPEVAARIEKRVRDWRSEDEPRRTRVLIDRADRHPYKQFQETKGPLNQIMIRVGNGTLVDVAKVSAVVAAATPFQCLRFYVSREDDQSLKFLKDTINEEIGKESGNQKHV